MNSRLLIFLLFYISPAFASTYNPVAEDQIIGKWMSTKENVMVNVYKSGNQFKAKVIWFKDSDDPSSPMNVRCDVHNANKALRKQRIIGMDVLKQLKYNPSTGRWEDGIIYDAKSGREWNSVVYFNDDGLLEIKGYWQFEFLCKTITFNRVN